jgi:hypothetical protein
MTINSNSGKETDNSLRSTLAIRRFCFPRIRSRKKLLHENWRRLGSQRPAFQSHSMQRWWAARWGFYSRRKTGTNNKKAPHRAGLFSYFVLVDFEIISSSFKNAFISSSSFGLEGGLRKGITSAIGLPHIASPRCVSFSLTNTAFLRRAFFTWLRVCHN